ncbi:MAG: NnrU family protein [Thermoanaerobaculia bacterium]
MQRLHYLAFGLAGYLAALLPMVYFAGFLANVFVPKSVDSGPVPLTSATGRTLAIDLALLASFGLVHSLLARRAVKDRLTRIFPAELERSLYSLIAGAQMALICWGWQPLPQAVWDLPAEWAALRLFLWVLEGAGWGIVIAALVTIDSTHLFGLRQAWDAARRLPHVAPRFEIRGLYRHVRHPVYTGSLLAFWSTPSMSQGRLLLVGALTIYLFIGLMFEERDLEREFGELFREQKRRVPALFPRLMK